MTHLSYHPLTVTGTGYLPRYKEPPSRVVRATNLEGSDRALRSGDGKVGAWRTPRAHTDSHMDMPSRISHGCYNVANGCR